MLELRDYAVSLKIWPNKIDIMERLWCENEIVSSKTDEKLAKRAKHRLEIAK